MDRRIRPLLLPVVALILIQPTFWAIHSQPQSQPGGEIRVGSISLPSEGQFSFGYGWGITSPPFSGLFPEQVAYPLGEGWPPPFLFVPIGYSNETAGIGGCLACPGLGAKECDYPTVSYGLGRLVTDIPDGIMTANLDEVVWLPVYRDEDVNPGNWGPVSVRYGDNRFYLGGTQDQEINATDIFSGRTEYYNLNKPGFVPIFDTTGHGTAILYEGEAYEIPFLNRTLLVEDINLRNATILVYDGAELETMLFLDYSSTVNPETGHVGKLFIYLGDLGGTRLEINDLPVAFFLDVLRVDNVNQGFMEVVLSGPWVDSSVVLRIDRDGDGKPDATELGLRWPRDAPPSDFDWFLLEGEDGPFLAGYIRINGTKIGPFALSLGGWGEAAGSGYGISSLTFWNGTSLSGPYWYVIEENGSWPFGMVRELGNGSWVLTEVEPDSGEGECGPVGCGRWKTFGLYKMGGGVCLRVGTRRCCRTTEELSFLGMHDYWTNLNPADVSPRNEVASYSWNPPEIVVEKYFGCFPMEGGAREPNVAEEVGGNAFPEDNVTENGSEGRLKIVSSEADRGAADWLGTSLTRLELGRPLHKIVLGGPSATSEGKEASEIGGIRFSVEGGIYSLWVESLRGGWSVSGADWALRDYAVAFAYEDEEGTVYAGMGITRYGTMAAAIWMADNPDAMSPGVGYVLRWEDADGDGVVDPAEILVIARFRLLGS